MIQKTITKFYYYYRNKMNSYSIKYRPLLFKSINSLVIVCFFCVSILQTGCSSSKIQISDYPHTDMKQYQYGIINSDDFSIVIRPLIQRDESLKYFGEDLLSKDILAVYVEVENRNVDSSYILFKDKISLAGALPASDSTGVVDTVATVSDGRGTMEAAVIFYALGIIVIPLMLVGAGMLVSGAKNISVASEKRHNFTIKELQTQTLSPGEGTSGFVYFKLTDKSLLSGKANINFKILDIYKQTTSIMTIPFNWEKTGGETT